MKTSLKIIILTLLPFLLFNCENVDNRQSQNAQPDNKGIFLFPSDEGINFEYKNPVELKVCRSCPIIQGKIKHRGGISSKYFKHSYSLELDQDTILLEGWHKDDDFIINSTYIDKSFIRHRLSYDLFRSFSEGNIAPKCFYTNVYLYDEFEGVYVVMQQVDKSLVNFDKQDSTAILVKDGGLFIGDSTSFKTQEGEHFYHQKHPEELDKLSLSSLNNFYHILHHSSDSLFEATIPDIVDLDNVIDWHILLLLTNNGDGVIKNFYWFKDQNRKWSVIPWDYDDSFGRNGDNTLQTQESSWERNALLKRCVELDLDSYVTRLTNKWKSLIENQKLENQINALIDSYINELNSCKLHQNFEKWPIDDPNYIDNFTFEEEIDFIKSVITDRIVKVDSIINTWETL